MFSRNIIKPRDDVSRSCYGLTVRSGVYIYGYAELAVAQQSQLPRFVFWQVFRNSGKKLNRHAKKLLKNTRRKYRVK